MNEKKLGQFPAFPSTFATLDRFGSKYDFNTPGMSTRLEIASKILAGLVSTELHGLTLAKATERVPLIVNIALVYTDELLKQEGD